MPRGTPFGSGVLRRCAVQPATPSTPKSPLSLQTFAVSHYRRISWQSSRGICNTRARCAKDNVARQLVPSEPARTRFAPSPTGYLHLGSLRTALFNYLLARKTGGRFLLRIEDTDQKRLVPDAEERLCDDLRWAGIQWDEGPEVGGPYSPYKQSERTPLYQEHAQKLLESGTAYRCFCTTKPPTAVEVDPSQIAVNVGGCQQDCASIPKEQSDERAHGGGRFAVRFLKPAFAPKWTDLVYGKISLGDKSVKRKLPQLASIDGAILLKGDGTPTYHLANVVDDHYMKITHVVRGTEWMSSTPLHVALYDAFKWTPPQFAHVGLLTDEEQNKLSKRNFDTDVRALREKHGILPEALTNFLALLGWRNPGRDDVMSLEQLVNAFDLKFTKGNTMVTLDKLWFLQRNHAAKRIAKIGKDDHIDKLDSLPADVSELVCLISDTARKTCDLNQLNTVLGNRSLETHVTAILSADPSNYENPLSYIKRNSYFFSTTPSSPITPRETFGTSTYPIPRATLVQRMSEIMLPAIRDEMKFWNEPGKNQVLKSPSSPNTQTLEDANKVSLALLASIADQFKGHTMSMATKAALASPEPSWRVDDDPQKQREGWEKAWHSAIHAYMREKLAFGMPGPSSGVTLAVLGRKEALRRLEA